MMKIARLKKQTKLVTPLIGMIKKSQLKIVLTLKAKTRNCCKIVLYQVLDKIRAILCQVYNRVIIKWYQKIHNRIIVYLYAE